MTEIDQIKTKVSIVELAEMFGAEPYGRGRILSCKNNPLRLDNNVNLKLYTDTNTYCDFADGEKSASVIDFYMKASGKDLNESLNDLKNLAGVEVEKKKFTKVTKNDYMTLEAVNKAFNSTFWKNINLKDDVQLAHLKTVTPEYVLKEANKEDLKKFMSLAKWSANLNTSVYRFPDYKGNYYTIKYRYKLIEDTGKNAKWVTMANTRSSYLYCHLTDRKNKTIVCEGARDYLNAILLGFDVIAPYSKNYKFTEEDYKLLNDRDCIFIDDIGEIFLKEVYDKAKCKSKVYFNHSKMECEKAKDLSDYLYHFKSLEDFKKAFENTTKNNGTWQDGLKDLKSILTKKTLEDAPEVEKLIDGFIYKGTLNVIHSKAGQGKTTFILSLIKEMLKNNSIDNFIYFDADNPMSVLKNRISKLTDAFGDKMIYHTHTLSSVQDLRNEMERLCLFKGQGTNSFLVVDTIGRFIDVLKDDEARPLMDLGNRLRDEFGATVLFVHHSNKEKDANDNVIFRGSTVIQGDCDFMWGLQRKGNEIIIKNDKGRLEYFEKIEAKVDLDNFDVELNGSYEFEEYDNSDDAEHNVSLEEICSFLTGKDFITMSEVQKKFYMHKTKEKRDAVWNIIKENKDKFITEKRGKGWYVKSISSTPIITEYDTEAELPDCLL